MTMRIVLKSGADRFAEDKEEARQIRLEQVMPALERGEDVMLDFGDVSYATQSYVHALIGEALQKHGEEALKNLEFKNCSDALRSVIGLVVDYTLGGFQKETDPLTVRSSSSERRRTSGPSSVRARPLRPGPSVGEFTRRRKSGSSRAGRSGRG
jgi:hypothetical protein